METKQVLKEVDALKRLAVLEPEAINNKTLTIKKAKMQALRITKNAEAYKKKVEIQAEIEAQIIQDNANARLEVAKNKSAAMITENEAEMENQEAMAGERAQKQRMKMLDSLKGMGYNSKVVLAGNTG